MHRKLMLFALQLEGYLSHFPHCHKYTLTQGIRQAYLDVYNLVTECQKRYNKKTTLIISAVRSDARKGRLESIVSRLGHARRTCSLKPLLSYLKDRHHAIFVRLPKAYRLHHHAHTAPA